MAIQAFRRKAVGEDTELSLNSFHPMPEELERTVSPSSKRNRTLIRKYGADNWYDWCIGNWGTKWDVQAVLEDEGADYLEYSFQSAWSPPVEWLKKLAQDYPRLLFRLKYEEDGVGFVGVATAKDGTVIDKCVNY